MLHQDLPLADVTPLDGASQWLLPALFGGAAASGALLAWMFGYPMVAAAFLVGGLVAAAGAALADRRKAKLVAPPSQGLNLTPDYSIIGATLGLTSEPAAVTSSEGALLIANSA